MIIGIELKDCTVAQLESVCSMIDIVVPRSRIFDIVTNVDVSSIRALVMEIRELCEEDLYLKDIANRLEKAVNAQR